MNKLLKGLAAGAVATLAPFTGQAEDVSLTLISQPPGGSWYSYGATFAEIIANSEGEHRITVEVLPRGGGMANPVAVNQRAADLGFTNANTAVWARDGIGEEFQGRESGDIRTVVGGLQISHMTIAARQAYVDRTGNDTLEKMINADSPPRFVLKPPGSQVPLLADYMFEAMGTSLDELRDRGAIVQIDVAQIAQMLRDGTADVYIESAPVGQATMTEVTLTTDMHFVPFPEEVLEHMAELGAPPESMPAGSYPGVDEDYVNPITGTLIVTHADVPEDVIYQVTRALVENRDRIAEAFPALAEWDPETGAQPEHAAIELHPGAARFYREQGWID
jgi:uncharacterized protein